MTNQHPITPPPELVQQWVGNAYLSDVHHNEEDWAYEQHIATRAAQWGADQELEACVGWLDRNDYFDSAGELRAVRRPKPPSLKEQALEILQRLSKYQEDSDWDTIRRALEALPE
jgi:hypothetical protein